MKTEIITFGTIAEGEKPDVSTKDVPVIHTETKTITYESSEVKKQKTPRLTMITCPTLIKLADDLGKDGTVKP